MFGGGIFYSLSYSLSQLITPFALVTSRSLQWSPKLMDVSWWSPSILNSPSPKINFPFLLATLLDFLLFIPVWVVQSFKSSFVLPSLFPQHPNCAGYVNYILKSLLSPTSISIFTSFQPKQRKMVLSVTSFSLY